MLEPEDWIDADVALEWADATANRWLRSNPVGALDDASPVADVRAGVAETIEQTSKAMAAYAASFGEQRACAPEKVAEWLRACCDSIGEPGEQTRRSRTMAALGDRRASRRRKRPLRRWTAAQREHLSSAGIRWLRGRDDGEHGFEVIRRGMRWNVIEHGWAKDEDDLMGGVIAALSAAAVRQSRLERKNPVPEKTLADHFHADAVRYCAEPGSQPPAWLL